MSFNSNGLQLFKQNQPNFVGNRLLVNGIEAPYLNVVRGWVRLRLLNASLARAYDLRLDNEQNMLLIAKDLGFLPKAKSIQSVILAPGERVEVLINMSEVDSVSLIDGKKRGVLDKVKNIFSSGDDLLDNTVIELRAQGEATVFSKTLNLTFDTDAPEMLVQPIAQIREFNIDVTNGLINQRRFDPRRIDVVVRKGTVERWILNANLPVGFTIQGAKFVVESQDDHIYQADELAWKDTVWVKGKTHILVRFDQVSSNNYPFLFGVSNLMLADMGCIGVMVVQ